MEGIASFGYWVRRRRKTLDLTQTTLAQRVGCSVFTVRKIERDERRPSRQMAELLADHLAIQDDERDRFLRMARGEFVASMMSPLKVLPLPSFLQTGDDPSQQEDTHFVAREHELGQLDGFLNLALAGHGQVVFVTGEAGYGKTALLAEFARRAQESQLDLIVVTGDCNPHSGIGDPYLPFRDALAMLSGDVEAKWAAGSITQDHARRLWQMLPDTIQALVDHGPDLINIFVSGRELVSRIKTATSSRSIRLERLEELAEREIAGLGGLTQSYLFEQYTNVLHVLAAQRPLLITLDDLQWADAASINLLFLLARRIEGSRIMIIGAYRPEEIALGRAGERHPLEKMLGEFKRYYGDIWINLTVAAQETQSREFVDALLDIEPNHLGENFRRELARLSQGHPMFTIELLRDMQERGDLRQDEQGYWVEGQNLDWGALPARIEGVIETRVGRLDPELREALTVASVEGEVFTAEVVAPVTGVEERTLVRRLSGELDRQHRLVRGRASQRLTTPVGQRLSRYNFRHHLFQHYLYHSLDPVERSYLHEAVGNELETLYKAETEQVAAQLARHFQEAGISEKAVIYLHQAGERAVRLSAHEEAIAHFNQGLDLLKSLPDNPDRRQQELDLLLALGPVLMFTQSPVAPEVEKIFTRARELCDQMGKPSQRFQALWGLWYSYFQRVEYQTAHELGEELLVLAQKEEVSALLMVAHRVLGQTFHWLGELMPALEHSEKCIALYDPQQHYALAFRYGQDHKVGGLIFVAHSLWFLGYPDQALEKSSEAVAHAQALSHPFSLAYALFSIAVFHLHRQEAQAALEHAEAAIDVCLKYGFAWLPFGQVVRGQALVKLGQPEEGLAQIRQGLAAIRLAPSSAAPWVLPLAEAYGQAGQVEKGLSILDEALATMKQVGFWEEGLYRLKGELLLKTGLERGRKDELLAEACFLKAIDIARQHNAKLSELRATVSLSRLWQSQGNHEEARQMLAEIYDWFTEGFDTVDLKEAKALLEELS